MDFLAHLLIGILASSWTSGFSLNLYLILGTFMGIAADLDFLLFPLWKRLPICCHHGITHSLIFVFAFSIFVYALLAALTLIHGLPDPRLLLLMLLTGSLHLLGDVLGTGGVPLLFPSSRKYFKLNIDVGIDFPVTIYSTAGIVTLAAVYSGYANLLDRRSITLLLGSIFVIYYAIRAVLKFYQQRKPENKGFAALPTINPFQWRFARRTETKTAIEIEVKTNEGVKTYRIPKGRKVAIERCEDLAYTYWHPEVQAEMRFFEYPCYMTRCQDGRMEIIWSSAEGGKIMEIQVICDEKGVCVKRLLRGKPLRLIKE